MRYTRWDQVVSTRVSNEILSDLVRWHLSQIAEKTSLYKTIESSLSSGDWGPVCQLDLRPEQYSISDYTHYRQIIAFFSKRRDLKIPGVDPEATALSKFELAESHNLETNRLFRLRERGGFFFPPRVEAVLHTAARKIARILGDLPSLEAFRFRFGPGATTDVKRRDASARRKFAQTIACSEDAIRYLPDILAEVPVWAGLDGPLDTVTCTVSVTRARVAFVPKNAKTHRTICVEPTLNTFVQAGIGDYMARRLRKHGIDIRDQSHNQRLARRGSLTGDLATLDLSSASDTISSMLVRDLLPDEWYDFLRAFRSSKVDMPDGTVRTLQMFSSMGNGFTFPLETLIFFALASSCTEDRENVSVYGDDIIVPTDAVPLLLEVLRSCGFFVNEEKSFWSGPFRESCGKDYYSGICVRPAFVKDRVSAADLFVLHNFYVRNGLSAPASLILGYLDPSILLWGPDGFGDGHLLGDFVPVPLNRRFGWAGYTFETYTYKPNKAFYRLGADYVYPSYSVYLNETAPAVSPDLFPDNGKLLRRSHGTLRDMTRSGVYRGSGEYLQDILPGTRGYKRIKIYYLG